MVVGRAKRSGPAAGAAGGPGAIAREGACEEIYDSAPRVVMARFKRATQ
jgi:hypothetical protein